MMDSEPVVALCAVVLFAAHYVYYWWRPKFDGVPRSLLKRHPRYAIRAFPEGKEGRIVGVASRGDLLLSAPMTSRECVAYVLRVHEHRGQRIGWVMILEVMEAVPFVVSDETGRAIIRAPDARLALTTDRSDQSDSLCPAAPKIEAFLETRGMTSVGRMLEYEEGTVLQGEKVSVLGVGHHEPTGQSESNIEGGYREQAKCLVMASTSEDALLISNAPSTFG